MPVIYEKSQIVAMFKMIILANSVLVKPYKSIGILDKNGQLPFLLPFICEKCGSISVFTENTAAYTDIQNEIYNDYGTQIILRNNASNINESDIIFAAKPTTQLSGNIFSLKNTENQKILLPFLLPDYCNEFCVAAGLFYYGNFKEFGKLTFKEEATTHLHL